MVQWAKRDAFTNPVPEIFADGMTSPALFGEVMRWSFTETIRSPDGTGKLVVPVADLIMPVGAFNRDLAATATLWLPSSICKIDWKH